MSDVCMYGAGSSVHGIVIEPTSNKRSYDNVRDH